MKQEVLEELFDIKYEEEDEDFLKLVNMYTSYKGDAALKDVIFSIYTFIQSTPFPKKWLEEKVELFNIENMNFEKTMWGKILFDRAKSELQDKIVQLEEEIENIKYEEDIEKFVVVLSEDARKIRNIYESKTWDDMFNRLNELKFDRLPSDKRVPDEIKEKIKELRGKIKKEIGKINDDILIYNSEDACTDIKTMYDILLRMKKIIIEFSDSFAKVKQDRNIMDFNDIEHFALEILTKESYEENNVRKKYIEKYEEILIDEYQDSNLVQENILSAISRGNNTFMVGDVKQSIYKFRQARPELFLEKYESYKDKEDMTQKDDLKIQLFKNFRSRKNILDFTNIIFDSIMSREIGDIDYNDHEYLNLGAEYKKAENLEIEVNIIDLKEEEESIYKDEKIQEDIEEKIEDAILEAKLTAKKVKELIDNRIFSV